MNFQWEKHRCMEGTKYNHAYQDNHATQVSQHRLEYRILQRGALGVFRVTRTCTKIPDALKKPAELTMPNQSINELDTGDWGYLLLNPSHDFHPKAHNQTWCPSHFQRNNLLLNLLYSDLAAFGGQEWPDAFQHLVNTFWWAIETCVGHGNHLVLITKTVNWANHCSKYIIPS